ncbi:MAG: ATP-dependent DNA helicase UvrD2, partial [Acidimicrobiales bacterium]|nr:ATP-dependent DNA helicase UvrD2 [Acidimicrobiales bacterium]
FAAAQRWRFRHLFVDEYQDLNRLQDRLLRAWLGDRPDLAVVGDPNQAIYGWNGAEPGYLTDIERLHPGTEVVVLEDSYRSTPQILATAGAVLGDRPGSAAALRPHRPDGPVPTIVGYATDQDEANGIARAAHDHHGPGRGWSSQAVLVRTNGQIAVIERALRRAAIPHRVRGAGDLLADRDVAGLLRDLDRRREPLATTLSDLQLAIDADRAELEAAEDPELPETTAAGRRIAAFQQVLRLGRDLLVVEPTARADDFGGWLRATLRDEGTERGDAVDIVSFHAAKGLEWSVVHVAGLEAGFVPVSHARTDDARAEEQRLLYVALTRAADVLRCTWAAQRTFGEREVERRPSPLLGPLRAVAAELAAAGTDAPDPTGALADSRAALDPPDAPPAPDPVAEADALRRALQRWRDAEARKVAAAPTVVLSDKAVEALVRVRPTSSDELAGLRDVGPATRERHGTRLLAIVAEPASA